MDAIVPRLLPFAVVGLAAVLSGRAAAQSEPAAGAPETRLEAAAADALISNAAGDTEVRDEVTVRGRRDEVGHYRLEMTKARDKIVKVFNEINSNDDNDLTCRSEKPTGSHVRRQVCRSKAQDAVDAGAARGFLDSLLLSTGINAAQQGPLFAPVTSNSGVKAYTAQNGNGVGHEDARAKLEAELKKMIAENRQLFRAVVKFVEARDDYNKARGAGKITYGEDSPAPE